MKNTLLTGLSLSLLCITTPLCAKDSDPVAKLSATIEESIFPPSSPISLAHEEIGMITNALLLLYADAYYTLRSYDQPLSPEQQRKYDVITQSLSGCLQYLSQEGTPAVHSALTAIRHNCSTLTRSYLRKHTEELKNALEINVEHYRNESRILADAAARCQEALESTDRTPERDDNGVALFNAAWRCQQDCDQMVQSTQEKAPAIKKHATAVQRINLNVYGIWYQVLYNGMQERNFEAACFDIVFGKEGFVPSAYRSGQLPAPEAIMVEVAS